MKKNLVVVLALGSLAFAAARPAHAEDDDDAIVVNDGSCPVHENEGLSEFGHDLGNIFKKIGGGIVDHGAQIPGYLELLGLRYPVKAYQEELSPDFWRGSRLDAKGFADLKARGFKATVDLTKEGTGDAQLAPKYGLNTMNIPTLDNSHPTEAQMVEFLDYVTAPENQPVYIHCEAGVGRTSIASAVYRMAVQGWSVDDALAEAEKHGMKLPNQVDFVKQFGADLAARKFPGYPVAQPAATASN